MYNGIEEGTRKALEMISLPILFNVAGGKVIHFPVILWFYEHFIWIIWPLSLI